MSIDYDAIVFFGFPVSDDEDAEIREFEDVEDWLASKLGASGYREVKQKIDALGCKIVARHFFEKTLYCFAFNASYHQAFNFELKRISELPDMDLLEMQQMRKAARVLGIEWQEPAWHVAVSAW